MNFSTGIYSVWIDRNYIWCTNTIHSVLLSKIYEFLHMYRILFI
jgi:hypothetical protein